MPSSFLIRFFCRVRSSILLPAIVRACIDAGVRRDRDGKVCRHGARADLCRSRLFATSLYGAALPRQIAWRKSEAKEAHQAPGEEEDVDVEYPCKGPKRRWMTRQKRDTCRPPNQPSTIPLHDQVKRKARSTVERLPAAAIRRLEDGCNAEGPLQNRQLGGCH